VRGISFDLHRGEVLGIVGESGSGKSATLLAMLGLLPGSARVGGSVRLDGLELIGAPHNTLAGVRGNRVSMIFQDPLSAFTPVYRIGDQLAEALRTHQDMSAARPASEPSSCWIWSAFPSRRCASTRSRMSSPAACGSAR